MPYFPPVLLASGARAGATDGAQTFENKIIIEGGTNNASDYAIWVTNSDGINLFSVRNDSLVT